MTVDQFIEWLRKNTWPSDRIAYIDFHGADIDSLKLNREEPDDDYVYITEAWG